MEERIVVELPVLKVVGAGSAAFKERRGSVDAVENGWGIWGWLVLVLEHAEGSPKFWQGFGGAVRQCLYEAMVWASWLESLGGVIGGRNEVEGAGGAEGSGGVWACEGYALFESQLTNFHDLEN